MVVREARIVATHADKLMRKLCKHFGHKVSAEFNDVEGKVDFQPGRCVLRAGDDELVLRVDDDEGAARACAILDAHLPRFLDDPSFRAEWRTIEG